MFIAEACAIDQALDIISKIKHKKFIIFSDSLTVLLSLSYKKLENSIIIKLLSKLKPMSNCKEIIICFIPSHIGVIGNERAGTAIKSALDLTPNKYKIPYTDLKPQINKFLHAKLQQCWNNNIHNKLFQIQPNLGEWRAAFRKSRREKLIISRLHIGHTWITFKLKQEQQPQYLTHQTLSTVKHRI